jgi:hypothetical protein
MPGKATRDPLNVINGAVGSGVARRLVFVELMFDTEVMTVRPLAEMRDQFHDQGGSTPPTEPIPVLPAMGGLLPGGLPRGQVVVVDAIGALPLALIAGAVPTGMVGADRWCAVVGVPEFGVVAAADIGADLDRMLLVDEPGVRWPEVVAALLPAVEVVLVQSPARPAPGVTRRLTALARQHGAVLIVAGAWEGARVRLQVTSSLWTGLGDGHGHLRARRVKVVADGRGGGVRSRTAWLWLPGPDGRVAAADLEAVEGTGGSAAPVTKPESPLVGGRMTRVAG